MHQPIFFLLNESPIPLKKNTNTHAGLALGNMAIPHNMEMCSNDELHNLFALYASPLARGPFFQVQS